MSTYEQRQNLQQAENEDKARKRNSHISKKKANDKTTSSNKKSSSKKAFAILRIKKLKTFANIKASSNHVHRVNETLNADSELTKNNRVLISYTNSNDVEADVKAYLNDKIEKRNEDGTYKIRKDNVLCCEHVLTASNVFFADKNSKKLIAWVNENMKFLKEQHGSNLIHAVLHLDETTPHIHAYTVPILDGKLNQKALTGSRAKMRKLQSDYAESMSKLGLERGIENSKAKHVNVRQFYNQLEKDIEITAPEFKTSLITIFYQKKTFEEQSKALVDELIKTKQQLSALRMNVNNAKQRAAVVSKKSKVADEKIEKAHKIVETAKESNYELRSINNQLINEQSEIQQKLELYQKYELEIKRLEEQSRLQKERELQQQRDLEKQARHAEYHKNNSVSRELTR